jgi:hypothetical protein
MNAVTQTVDIYQINPKAFRFKYLGDFETKIKNILGVHSGPQIVSFGIPSLDQKVSCKCDFKKYSSHHATRILDFVT